MQFASITCILSGICKLCNMFHSTRHLKPTGNQERKKLLQLASLCKILHSTKQCNRHGLHRTLGDILHCDDLEI